MSITRISVFLLCVLGSIYGVQTLFNKPAKARSCQHNASTLWLGVNQEFLFPWMVSKCWGGSVTCISGNQFCICSLNPYLRASVVLLSSAAPLLWNSHFISLSTQPQRPLPCVHLQLSLQGCVQVRCTLLLGSLTGILAPQLLGYTGSCIQRWIFPAHLHVLNCSEVKGNCCQY